MKKELEYFNIDSGYGGNQSWFLDPWMHIGGCGALTMCDFLIYMAKNRGRAECYPYDIGCLSRRNYRKFGMSMKPYLRPRESGIKDLETFIDGARIYLEDCEIDGIELEGFSGEHSYEEAEEAIRASIDRKMPVAMLMLKHRDRRFNFFEWHWFIVNGYDEGTAEPGTSDAGEPGASGAGEPGGRFMIKAATYGKAHWLPLKEFWDTGHKEKGGLVLFRETE